MNGPEENSSLYLPRISVFREVKPTLIKLSKVIVKTQEHAWVIFLKIGEGGRGGARLCYRLLRASREFTEMANVLTDLSRHKKLLKNLLVYLKLALLRYAHERIRVLISYDLRKFRHLYDKWVVAFKVVACILYLFFPSDKFFSIFSDVKRIICAIKKIDRCARSGTKDPGTCFPRPLLWKKIDTMFSECAHLFP